MPQIQALISFVTLLLNNNQYAWEVGVALVVSGVLTAVLAMLAWLGSTRSATVSHENREVAEQSSDDFEPTKSRAPFHFLSFILFFCMLTGTIFYTRTRLKIYDDLAAARNGAPAAQNEIAQLQPLVPQVAASPNLVPTPSPQAVVVTSPSPLPNPEPELTKQIENQEYVIKKDPVRSGTVLYTRSETGSLDRVRSNLPIPDLTAQTVLDFWYDKATDTLLTIENRGANYSNVLETVNIIKWEKDEPSLKTVLLGSPGLYAADRILKYYPYESKILFLQMGGDGCGGWGKVWSLSNETKKDDVVSVASGCGDIKLPRYVGFTGDVLVLAEHTEGQGTEAGFEGPIKRIYSLHPFTKEEKTILTEEQIPAEAKQAELLKEDSTKLLFYTDDSYNADGTRKDPLATYDLVKKEFAK